VEGQTFLGTQVVKKVYMWTPKGSKLRSFLVDCIIFRLEHRQSFLKVFEETWVEFKDDLQRVSVCVAHGSYSVENKGDGEKYGSASRGLLLYVGQGEGWMRGR
jgi:hypothetical protein